MTKAIFINTPLYFHTGFCLFCPADGAIFTIMKKYFFLLISLAHVMLASYPASALDLRAEPETASIMQRTKSVAARQQMVVAANPHASAAGLEILRLGGSATDAAIAVQMVLNLVEPQSSGIGGGAFLLHWDEHSRRLTSFDGRETAPRAARPDRFLKNGKPMAFRDAMHGGLSVGTPGVLRMLEKLHRRHGRLSWKRLFKPAIELARKGFAVSPRLHTLLKKADPQSFGPRARGYFYDEFNEPRPVGYILKNIPFALALEGIANQGADFFYKGQLAGFIVKRVKTAERNPGDMSTGDLAGYHSFERPPVCISYRSYRVCGMGPPSSGMLTIAQILKLVEPFDLGRTPLNIPALHLIAEAEKLAYADRKRYMADSDFIRLPQGLLDPRYLAQRRLLISRFRSMGKAKAGQPPWQQGQIFGKDSSVENHGTSHISIIDRWGNAVSMTTTIEAAFGARIMVSGFLLNNELTDFSFRPTDEKGHPVANRVQPLKRPRSSMSPTMIFDRSGRLHMVVGSPGGSRIILYVLKTIIGHIDWGLDGEALTQLPNFGSRNGPFELEEGTGVREIAESLEALGHKTRIVPMTSGVHLVIRSGNRLIGAVDPRREGLALGD